MKSAQKILREEMSRWVKDEGESFDTYFFKVYTTAEPTVMQTIIEKAMDKYGEQFKKRNQESLRKEDIAIVIGILNAYCKTNFSPTSKSASSHINARLVEGFSIHDFELVISDKSKKWNVDEKMREYLRPQTLFAGKFEAYLQQAKRNLPIAIPVHKDFDGNEIK